jgi:hypothetical protein
MQDKIRNLEQRIAELQEQNAYLYESAATFSQLAERLNTRLREEIARNRREEAARNRRTRGGYQSRQSANALPTAV